jgi:isopentenyl phosphate kinase
MVHVIATDGVVGLSYGDIISSTNFKYIVSSDDANTNSTY